jgi:hypothetical protein
MCEACRGITRKTFCKGRWQRDDTIEPIVVPKLTVTAGTLIGKKNMGLRLYRGLNTSVNTFYGEDILMVAHVKELKLFLCSTS